MKRGVSFFGFVLVSLMFIGLVGANFEVGNLSHSIKKDYSSNDFLEGWINISLNGEDGTSKLTSSMGGSIELKDILDLNEIDYRCIPSECENGYETKGTEKTSETISLNGGQEKTYGVKLIGDIRNINSFEFDISSDVGMSCSNQLEIDLLDDGENDFNNNKTGSICGKSYGCYSESFEKAEFNLEGDRYCQRMEINPCNGFYVGAEVKKVAGGQEKNFSFYVYDKNYREVGVSCKAGSNSENWNEIKCLIEYPVMERENYTICIGSDSATTDYKIKANLNNPNKCGFYGLPSPRREETSSYKIFTERIGYGNFGSQTFQNEIARGERASDLIDGYIDSFYGTRDCSRGCIIPIRLKSNTNQRITLNNLRLSYGSSSGAFTENKFYELDVTPPKLSSSGFIQVDLGEDKFNLSGRGSENIELSLGGKKIFEEEITLGYVPEINSLTPRSAIAGRDTTFNADIKIMGGFPIKECTWDFGNNITQKTQTGNVTYTYGETGEYNLTLKVEDSRGRINSQTFRISVGTPVGIVNSTLRNENQKLSSLENQLSNMDRFLSEKIKEIMRLNESKSQLRELSGLFDNAMEEEDYIRIMHRLESINLPSEIHESLFLESQYVVNGEDAYLDEIEEIIGEMEEDAEEGDYNDAITQWALENLEIKIGERAYVGRRGAIEDFLAKYFVIEVTKKSNYDGEIFFIIGNERNMQIDSLYKTNGSYNYIEMGSLSSKREIKILVEDSSLNMNDLKIFILPEVSELSVDILAPPICNKDGICDPENGETSENCEDCVSKKTPYVLVTLLAIFVIISLIGLYYWYKKNYEAYLFGTKSNLYNLVSYINNEKARGKSDTEIKRNLAKSGWSGEQIKYVFKRYKGKGQKKKSITENLNKPGYKKRTW